MLMVVTYEKSRWYFIHRLQGQGVVDLARFIKPPNPGKQYLDPYRYHLWLCFRKCMGDKSATLKVQNRAKLIQKKDENENFRT